MMQRHSIGRLMILAAFVLLTASVMPALAEDVLMNGGRSPDGRYEVHITHDRNPDPADSPDGYSLHLQDTKAKKRLSSLGTIGGNLRYEGAKERCRALWHASGQFVAISDQATRHSREIYIFAISDGSVAKLDFTDYIQNALGRVNATEVDLHCISTPKAWNGDDLSLEFYFSIARPEGGRMFYSVDVTLHLVHGPNTAPGVGLKGVGTPKKLEG